MGEIEMEGYLLILPYKKITFCIQCLDTDTAFNNNKHRFPIDQL